MDVSAPADLFMLPPVPPLQRHRAGYHHLAFDMAGSTARGEYCRALGCTAVKCGVTSARTVDQRLEDLWRECYAGLAMRPGAARARACGRMVQDDHARGRPRGVALPVDVHLAQGHIVIDVRDGVTIVEADDAVAALLASRALNAFLATPDGRARRNIGSGFTPAPSASASRA